jgi:hypothetical protein
VCGKASLDLDISHPNALYYFNNEKVSSSKINTTQSGIYKLKIKNTVCAEVFTLGRFVTLTSKQAKKRKSQAM